MSEALPITPEQFNAVVESVNSLKTGGMIFIASMAIIIITYMIISKIFSFKREKLIAEQKNARVEAQLNLLKSMSDSMDRVKTELTQLNANSHTEAENQKRHNEALLMAQNYVNSQLDTLGKKIRGVISDVDASKLIKTYFNSIIKREVIYIVEAQIIENGFKESSDFIRRDMKTKIGEILDRCQTELRELKLPIPVSSIFLTYKQGDAERYQICDLIWDNIMPILAREGDKAQKIKEAKVIITNIVTDYIAPVVKELTESATDKYHAALQSKEESAKKPSGFMNPVRKTPLPDNHDPHDINP
jgi:hypothetical protein